MKFTSSNSEDQKSNRNLPIFSPADGGTVYRVASKDDENGKISFHTYEILLVHYTNVTFVNILMYLLFCFTCRLLVCEFVLYMNEWTFIPLSSSKPKAWHHRFKNAHLPWSRIVTLCPPPSRHRTVWQHLWTTSYSRFSLMTSIIWSS